MTKIRIDTGEMEAVSRSLTGVANRAGEIGTSVKAQCCATPLPPAAAGQVTATVNAVESTLRTIQVELLLHALLLALRGLIAAHDSVAVAAGSNLAPATVSAVATSAAVTPSQGSRPLRGNRFRTLYESYYGPGSAGGSSSGSSGSGSDPIIALAQNGAAGRKLAQTSPIAQANVEFRSGSDINNSSRIGDLKLNRRY